MEQKKFNFKIEDLLTIAVFLLNSLKKDLNDFRNFSTVFTDEFLAEIETKINACTAFVSSSLITKELKAVTQSLYDKSKALRLNLNILEGYLKLAGENLDILIGDTGLKNVRAAISKGNTEGVLLNLNKLLLVVKRNLQALIAKGMKQDLILELEQQLAEINDLNAKQNDLTGDRNRLTRQNISLFNELWDSLQPILKTARAIYRNVDEAKMKDYTVAQLLKRINS